MHGDVTKITIRPSLVVSLSTTTAW